MQQKEAIKQAANRLGMKPLKSDNIALGGVIPLPNGIKYAIVEEVELCKVAKQASRNWYQRSRQL